MDQSKDIVNKRQSYFEWNDIYLYNCLTIWRQYKQFFYMLQGRNKILSGFYSEWIKGSLVATQWRQMLCFIFII